MSAETLEEIVRDSLRPHVDELVRRLLPELVAEAIAGNGAPSTLDVPQDGEQAEAAANGAESPSKATRALPAAPDSRRATKVCRLCNKTKPPEAFDRHRAQCKSCRARRARRRLSEGAAIPEPEEPRPAPTAAELLELQPGGVGNVTARELESWLRENELATIEDGRVILTARAAGLVSALRP